MYTVKQVVTMTGLTAATLRAWERRYGVVSPRRTEGHYRMFSEADVARLRQMVQLIDAGAQAHKAAEIVLTAPSPAQPTPTQSCDPATLADTAAALDPERLRTLLDAALPAGDGFESACDDWLNPAIREVYQRVKSGELSDVHQRIAQRAINRRLNAILDQTPLAGPPSESRSSERPVVLVAQQEVDGSEVLPLIFTIALRSRGADARAMGTGISPQGWRVAIEQLRPRSVAVATTSTAGHRKVRELVRELSSVTPPVQVWLGGPQLDPSRPGHLPLHVRGAVDRLLSHLWGGSGPAAATQE